MSHAALIQPLKDAGKRKLAHYLARFEALLSQFIKGKQHNYSVYTADAAVYTAAYMIFHYPSFWCPLCRNSNRNSSVLVD